MVACRFNQYAGCYIEIAAVTDLQRDHHADLTVAVGMIEDAGGNHRLVWNEGFGAVSAAHHDTARCHLVNPAGMALDSDDIANFDRTVEQNDEAADVVAGDFL